MAKRWYYYDHVTSSHHEVIFLPTAQDFRTIPIYGEGTKKKERLLSLNPYDCESGGNCR